MRLLLSGGGTGGHLFPAIAVAEECTGRNDNADILFVGTKAGLEARLIPEQGWEIRYVLSGGIKGRGLAGAVAGLFKAFWGFLQSIKIIADFRPGVILGMGGYASAPAIVAGRLFGISSAIHEQNAMPGLANRLLGHFANRVFLTYPESGRFFSAGKTIVTGNPVRKEFLENGLKATGENEKFTVFVFGGSRGAHRINEVVSEAMTGSLRAEKIRLIHQTGANDLEDINKRYRDAGIDAEVQPFIDDMLAAYMKADLVICRAGATTIAELMAMGKPSLLIPYPYAADDHQATNAQALVDAGAAEMILEFDLDAGLLAGRIKSLMADEKRICEMGKRAAGLARKDTARIICEELQKLAA